MKSGPHWVIWMNGSYKITPYTDCTPYTRYLRNISIKMNGLYCFSSLALFSICQVRLGSMKFPPTWDSSDLFHLSNDSEYYLCQTTGWHIIVPREWPVSDSPQRNHSFNICSAMSRVGRTSQHSSQAEG